LTSAQIHIYNSKINRFSKFSFPKLTPFFYTITLFLLVSESKILVYGGSLANSVFWLPHFHTSRSFPAQSCDDIMEWSCMGSLHRVRVWRERMRLGM
jgi:hypothetical protein